MDNGRKHERVLMFECDEVGVPNNFDLLRQHKSVQNRMFETTHAPGVLYYVSVFSF